MKIFLIGMPGSGKTSVGKQLGDALDIPSVDIDQFIEEKHHLSIDEIFELYQEDTFRDMESEALLNLPFADGVISTGGGIVTRPQNKKNMDGLVIYIDTPVEVITARLAHDSTRPLLKTNSLENLYQKRSKLYEDFADIKVSNKDSINTCVDDIIEVLKDRGII